jgi:LPXTG-motif cell wall-anchored protein
MVRTNQGGSVLSFIIIGVILTILLAGGVYIVRWQVTGSNPSQSTPISQQPPTTPPQKETPGDSGTSHQQEPPAKEKTDPTTQTQVPQTAPVSGENNSRTAALPQTGPAETIGILVALGFLSVASVSYLRSRRPELSL